MMYITFEKTFVVIIATNFFAEIIFNLNLPIHNVGGSKILTRTRTTEVKWFNRTQKSFT